jgi:hypothetical protein
LIVDELNSSIDVLDSDFVIRQSLSVLHDLFSTEFSTSAILD